jgi:hypothetical protein
MDIEAAYNEYIFLEKIRNRTYEEMQKYRNEDRVLRDRAVLIENLPEKYNNYKKLWGTLTNCTSRQVEITEELKKILDDKIAKLSNGKYIYIYYNHETNHNELLILEEYLGAY